MFIDAQSQEHHLIQEPDLHLSGRCRMLLATTMNNHLTWRQDLTMISYDLLFTLRMTYHRP